MNMEITAYLADCVRNRTPVSFSKYGDGEYLAATNRPGANCDRDTYTEKLAEGLRRSFTYMVDEAPNTYIGIWHDGNHIDFWSTLVQKPIQIAKYHSVIMDSDHRAEKIDLLKAIKESSLKKIYMCNPLMVRAKSLLNIDHMIHVPFNNWFDTKKDDILQEIETHIQPDEQCIIMTSAGMGAKILIAELSKKYPQNIYLDIGSGLDKVCTKKASRGWEPSYVELVDLLKELLPEDWESPVYQSIFDEARHKLGVHAEWLNYYV
jgi:hypothetical protein